MLTLITVNYRCAERTVALLRSLEQQGDTAFDVIVVDNDSPSDDRATLGAYATGSPLHLDIIYSDTNRGFSGGNNLAIRKALVQGSEWILLINPDTTVGPDFIASLRQRLPSEPAIVAVPLDEGNGRVAYAGIVRWLHATLPHSYQLQATSYQLPYVIGAGLLIHRDVFEHIGLLDEAYFLYFEDAEFSMRARHAGVPIRFLDAPIITHAISASTTSLGSPLLLRYHYRNALRFNARQGPFWVRISLHSWSFLTILKQAVKLFILPARRPQSRAILAGIFDFYARRFGHIPDEHPPKADSYRH